PSHPPSFPTRRSSDLVGPNGFLNRPNVVPGVPKKSAAILNGTWDPTAAGAAGSVLNFDAWTDPAAKDATKFTLGDAPRTDGAARDRKSTRLNSSHDQI